MLLFGGQDDGFLFLRLPRHVTYQPMPTSLARQPLADDAVVGVDIQTDSDHS